MPDQNPLDKLVIRVPKSGAKCSKIPAHFKAKNAQKYPQTRLLRSGTFPKDDFEHLNSYLFCHFSSELLQDVYHGKHPACAGQVDISTTPDSNIVEHRLKLDYLNENGPHEEIDIMVSIDNGIDERPRINGKLNSTFCLCLLFTHCLYLQNECP